MIRRLIQSGLAAAVAAAGMTTGLALAPDHADAAFPGANGKIVFASHRDDASPVVSGEIYVMNADGSGQTRLTNNGLSADSDPAWSPNGQKIAWESTQGDNDREVFVMNADGSGQTQVSDGVSVNQSPAWSPDGQKIAFVSLRDGDYEIFVMNADGSGLTQLTHNTLWDDNPAWSPDGQKIAFQSVAIGQSEHEIFVMNADGSGLTQLPIADLGGESPTWSPDGLKIAYSGASSDDQGGLTTGIFIMNADGSDSTVLSGFGSAMTPRWSPDGQQITFTSNTNAPTNWDVYVMDADGNSAPQRLTTEPSGDFTGDWQPLTAGVPTDDIPPVVTCDTPTPAFLLGGPHAADVTATVTDAESGPASSPVAADVTATDVATVGVKSKSLTGYDNAANATTVDCPFVVAYGFGDFLSPLPSQKNKAGSMIPVKFQLTDASGATISDAEAQSLLTPCAIEISFDGVVQAGCVTYDAVTDTFKFEVKTSKTTPKGSHTISVEITAADGSGLIQTKSIQVKVA